MAWTVFWRCMVRTQHIWCEALTMFMRRYWGWGYRSNPWRQNSDCDRAIWGWDDIHIHQWSWQWGWVWHSNIHSWDCNQHNQPSQWGNSWSKKPAPCNLYLCWPLPPVVHCHSALPNPDADPVIWPGDQDCGDEDLALQLHWSCCGKLWLLIVLPKATT